MKKYIPVFGPQELFDGAENCDEYLVAVQHSVGQKTKVSFYPSLVEAFNYVTDFPPRGVVFHRAAMRRIINPPVWTKADEEAGKLPEVGCKAVQIQGFCEVDVLMIHNGCVVVCNSEISDSRPAAFKIDSFMELFTPLETPAEKAARLKSEWCAKAAKQLKNLEYTSTLTSIYDALLSGELQAPKGE